MRDFLWMAAGAAVLAVVTLMARHFGTEQDLGEQRARHTRKIELVNAMRLALASASEAEKSAVLAVTDQDSQTYADQARAVSADVERRRQELDALLKEDGTQGERDFLGQFSKAFTDFQRIDSELLTLAAKNTNLKAYGLAYGPAAVAVREMDAALSRLMAKAAGAAPTEDVMRLSLGALTGALRIQALLAPHIAEESNEKMDELEARMAEQDREVRKDLVALATVQKVGSDPDVKAASSAYDRFGEVRTQLLTLSRENTNVRSVAISLNQKRKVTILCQGALEALQQAVLEEPNAGIDYGRFGRPADLP